MVGVRREAEFIAFVGKYMDWVEFLGFLYLRELFLLQRSRRRD